VRGTNSAQVNIFVHSAYKLPRLLFHKIGVQVDAHSVTFLDTPGHNAFTATRLRLGLACLDRIGINLTNNQVSTYKYQVILVTRVDDERTSKTSLSASILSGGIQSWSPVGQQAAYLADRKRPDQTHYSPAISDTGCIRDYHPLDFEGEDPDHKRIEAFLSKVEAEQAELVRRIRATKHVAASQRKSVAAFISLMRYRVPRSPRISKNFFKAWCSIRLKWCIMRENYGHLLRSCKRCSKLTVSMSCTFESQTGKFWATFWSLASDAKAFPYWPSIIITSILRKLLVSSLRPTIPSHYTMGTTTRSDHMELA